MDYRRFVTETTFSCIGPFDKGVVLLTGHEPPTVSDVDLNITRLPVGDIQLKARLAEACAMPRMSTFAVGALINLIVANLPPGQAFVNVGVWHGFSLLSGMAGNPDTPCIGIDNFSQFGGPREAFLERFNRNRGPAHAFYDIDYRDFFNRPDLPPIGFYFYDGDHSRENQHRGLAAAEPYLADGALILVDDFNFDEAIDGTRDFVNASAFAYDVVVEQHTCHNWHPTFWNGIALLRKGGLKRQDA